MRKQPDDEVLENLHFTQLDKADQLKQLLALYIQDTACKAEPRSYSQEERTVTHCLEQKLRWKHVSSLHQLHDKLAPVVAAFKEKEQGEKVIVVSDQEGNLAVSRMTQQIKTDRAKSLGARLFSP